MGDREVDAVRRFYAAWTARDVPAMLAEIDPDVEAEPVLGLLYERPSYRGHGGMVRWFEEVDDLWDDFEARVEQTYEVGDEVVALLTLLARSGDSVSDARIAVVCGFRDGRIVSFRGRDRDEVLEELGLGA